MPSSGDKKNMALSTTIELIRAEAISTILNTTLLTFRSFDEGSMVEPSFEVC